jgi:hypothetical protein
MTANDGATNVDGLKDEPKVEDEGYELQHVNVLPHVGRDVRFTGIRSDRFHVKTGGYKIFSMETPHEIESGTPTAQALI